MDSYYKQAHLALHELYELGEGERRAVDLGHKEALKHHPVERRIGTASKEAVQLHTSSHSDAKQRIKHHEHPTARKNGLQESVLSLQVH
jgi:hypothetical protein